MAAITLTLPVTDEGNAKIQKVYTAIQQMRKADKEAKAHLLCDLREELRAHQRRAPCRQ